LSCEHLVLLTLKQKEYHGLIISFEKQWIDIKLIITVSIAN